MDVIQSYFRECSRKLRPGGTGFIHHSNLGAYQALLQPKQGIRRKVDTLMKLTHLAGSCLLPHRRGTSVTAGTLSQACESTGLKCLTQEIVNWGNDPRYLID